MIYYRVNIRTLGKLVLNLDIPREHQNIVPYPNQGNLSELFPLMCGDRLGMCKRDYLDSCLGNLAMKSDHHSDHYKLNLYILFIKKIYIKS